MAGTEGALAGVGRVRLWPQEQLWQLTFRQGKVSEMHPARENEPPPPGYWDAGGAFALPSLVEAHIHPDKAFWPAAGAGDSLPEVIRSVHAAKARRTPEAIHRVAHRVLAEAVQRGVTHLRCHAEVDPVWGLASVEALLYLRRRWSEILDMQVVAFPQDGIARQPGTRALLERALALGADVVGGVPYVDPSPEEHLHTVFRLAAEWGTPVDLHLDFFDGPEHSQMERVVELARAYHREGQVLVGHATALASMPPTRVRTLARRLADAGIAVVALPTTDLLWSGRGDSHAVRRGLAPLRLLREAGVVVAVSSNNVKNPFTPFGLPDPLGLLPWVMAGLHWTGTEQAVHVVDLITHGAARAIGVDGYGRFPGGRADLAVFAPDVPGDEIPLGWHRPRAVIHGGALVVCHEHRLIPGPQARDLFQAPADSPEEAAP